MAQVVPAGPFPRPVAARVLLSDRARRLFALGSPEEDYQDCAIAVLRHCHGPLVNATIASISKRVADSHPQGR